MKSTEQQHVPALSFSCAPTYDSTKSMRRYKGSSDAEVTHFVVTQLYMYLLPRYTISNCKNRTPIHIHCTSISEYLSIAKMTSKKPQNGRKNARKAFRPIKVIAPTAHAPVFVESPPNFLRFLFFPTFSSVPPGIQTRASEARTHSSKSNAYTKSVTRYFIF